MTGPDLDTVFVRWIWYRAVLHRGWWLVTSVYLVVDAHLSAAQLVMVGVAQGVVALVFEVPAGVVADTFSRKWSLVVSHVLMGTAMITTGLVTGYGPLVATQMLWGLSWTFASGAEVAWISDELHEPARVSLVLMRSGRAQLTGAVVGMVGMGGLAWLVQRSTAMVLAGTAMLLLGLYVVSGFREQRFVPASTGRWSASWSILVRGSALARGSRVILVMFAATFLVNGVSGAFGRLYPLRLIDIGLPADPVVWLTALGVLAFLTGAVALRIVQPHIEGVPTVRRSYVIATGVAALGVIGLVSAPEKTTGSVAVLLAAGALPLTRTFGTIWVNRQTGNDVRATVHSLLAQAEHLGVIACGLAIAAVARFAGLPLALVTCGTLLTITIVLIQRLGRARSLTPVSVSAARRIVEPIRVVRSAGGPGPRRHHVRSMECSCTDPTPISRTTRRHHRKAVPMTDTMRAVVLDAPGPPEALTIREVPRPTPVPGWVLIQVKAFGLNRSELHIRLGLAEGVTFPRVPGIEATGVVAACPGGEFAIGQQVVAMMGGMGRTFDGGYAEYTCVPATQVIAFSSTLDWSTLGAVPEMLQTAYGSLTVGLDARAGQSILIRGGTSSVGMATAVLARQQGMTVLATTRNPDKASALTAVGVDHVLIDDGDVAGKVRAIHPEGVDAALELVGTPTLPDTLRSVRVHGVVCFTGMLSNEWTVPDFYPIDYLPRGVRLSAYGGDAGDLPPSVLQGFLDAVAAGRTQVPIAHVYDFEQIVAAHAAMEAGAASGKLVVTIP